VKRWRHGLLWSALCGACASPLPKATVGPLESADAILVLGHRPARDENGIEAETRARVEHGVALYRAGRAPLLLVAGGESTPHTVEADVMAAHAEDAGVPAAAILRERASRDTVENARFAIGLLRDRVGTDRLPRVVLVTSDYHIERATYLVRCAGAAVEPAPVTLQLSAKERAQKQRSERWVRFYYRFIDPCGRAAKR
jgi:uncharacterized SAM-binding protein YcdF (DUF218 family)